MYLSIVIILALYVLPQETVVTTTDGTSNASNNDADESVVTTTGGTSNASNNEADESVVTTTDGTSNASNNEADESVVTTTDGTSNASNNEADESVVTTTDGTSNASDNEADEFFDASIGVGMPIIFCKICFEYVPLDQCCFCDYAMAVNKSSSSSSSSKPGQNTVKESHAFCIECLQKYGESARETLKFADGGLGLKCMEADCTNPITWQEIRAQIPGATKLIQELENLCDDLLVLGQSARNERCPKCNCVVEVDIPVDEQRKFQCPQCGNKICRKCKVPWTNDHYNGTFCDKLVEEENLKIVNRLSDVVIHICNKCHLQFMKEDGDGCNYVQCANNLCNGTHCYCCKMPEIKSNHFCGCVPKNPCTDNPTKCSNVSCGKCLLTSNVDQFEQHKTKRILAEYETKNNKKFNVATSSSSSASASTEHKGKEKVAIIKSGRNAGKEHQERELEELLEQKSKEIRLKMEELLSAVVIYECPNCKMQFQKSGGSNNATCSNCHQKYCFCCRKSVIDAEQHFCSCNSEKSSVENPCKCANVKCKKCLRHGDIDKLEQLKIEQIEKEFRKKTEKGVETKMEPFNKFLKIFDHKSKEKH